MREHEWPVLAEPSANARGACLPWNSSGPRATQPGWTGVRCRVSGGVRKTSCYPMVIATDPSLNASRGRSLMVTPRVAGALAMQP